MDIDSDMAVSINRGLLQGGYKAIEGLHIVGYSLDLGFDVIQSTHLEAQGYRSYGHYYWLTERQPDLSLQQANKGLYCALADNLESQWLLVIAYFPSILG